jgi:type VI secretion system secreted protein Hcp
MAVSDFFLKLDGIPGEAQDSKHKGEIDLESWSWSEQNAGTGHLGGGSGTGKVSGGDLHFTMRVSKASPKLFLACANGDHIKTGLITCRKAGKNPLEYLKIKLTDVFVSSYQTGGSKHSDVLPIDQVSLNFVKMEVEYDEQAATGAGTGKTSANWNFKENKGE